MLATYWVKTRKLEKSTSQYLNAADHTAQTLWGHGPWHVFRLLPSSLTLHSFSHLLLSPSVSRMAFFFSFYKQRYKLPLSLSCLANPSLYTVSVFCNGSPRCKGAVPAIRELWWRKSPGSITQEIRSLSPLMKFSLMPKKHVFPVRFSKSIESFV